MDIKMSKQLIKVLDSNCVVSMNDYPAPK